MYKKYMKEMRERTGSVTSRDPLVTFFYVLMRDELTPGKIEGLIMKECLNGEEIQFTNGHLANYAKDLADKFRDYRD